MFRVPGSRSSLEKEKAKGASVKMVYSSIDALELAKKDPDKEVAFLGIGFETTAPTVAQSILAAKKDGLENYSVLCGHKTMPGALKALAGDENIKVDGFLLPGHVSAVIGAGPYEFLSRRYKKRCVITGFEPLDIMQAILMLIEQKAPTIAIQYTRIINKGGNKTAQAVMDKVFQKNDSEWRGIGNIKDSGLSIRKEYKRFDAGSKFRLNIPESKENKYCICGDVLKGVKIPLDCRLFGKACTPENPVGACMVSSEGACAAYYKYKR